MSGGHFDYFQYQMGDIEDQLEVLIENDKEWVTWKPETIQRFKECLEHMKTARIMLHRIDWLVSGDDSEDTFHIRLKEELDA